MLSAFTHRINSKQLNGFLILFWALTIVACVLWFFIQITQQGLLAVTQSSIFGLYLFLLFFMTMLKLMALARFQTSKVGLTLLFIVEILSLNFTTVIPLFLLRSRLGDKAEKWTSQTIFTVGLLGVALILQMLVYIRLFKMS